MAVWIAPPPGVNLTPGESSAFRHRAAQSVQYVKVCSLYGAGFYYIPGTDMCLKIGGWTRFEAGVFANGSLTNGPLRADTNNRLTHNDVWRARGYITADAREQTAYGVARAYIAVGLNSNDTDGSGIAFSSNRAFIQWAGFTFGLTQSFYDFYITPATAYFGFYPASDTGDGGWLVAAYTAQFGNGWSVTLGAEQRRMTQIINANGTAGVTGGAAGQAASSGSLVPGTAFPGGAYGGLNAPDIVANTRIDQAWGSAQIMGALHEVNSQYYGATESTGGPSDKWGFAVGGGLKLNAPMFGQGDYFQSQINYAQGATRYVNQTPNYNYGYRNGDSAAFGILSDAVYGGTVAAGTATDLQLTTAWGVNLAYEHFWNPAWRTSLYGGYMAVSYNSTANANLCTLEAAGAGLGTAAVATAGCNNNWNQFWIGSRTQWNVTKTFYMGVDVVYQRLHGAQFGGTNLITLGSAGTGLTGVGGATNVFNNSDQNNVAVRFRVHKDFYP